MTYIQAAMALGYPADCATAGGSYADFLRTWNAQYGSPPPLTRLQARLHGSVPKSTSAKRAKQAEPKPSSFWARLFGGAENG